MVDSAVWVKVFPPVLSDQVGKWAKVSGGTVTTVTNPDGSVDEIHTFLANGTLTVDSPGYARVLLVGGGGASTTTDTGSGGDFLEGIYALPAGANAVVVGAGGSGAAWGAGVGKKSSCGPVTTADVTFYQGAGGVAGSQVSMEAGRVSSISGSAVTYGAIVAGTTTPNLGQGAKSSQTSGSSGIVIVRVRTTEPTVSDIAATGGTVTEFTGDGTNGVLGQKYRVHTFNANGSLVVSKAGDADVFMISGGGATSGSQATKGAPGRVLRQRLTLGAGTLPVVVGIGGVSRSDTARINYGRPSSLGSLTTGYSMLCDSDGGPAAGAVDTATWTTPYTTSIDGTAKQYGKMTAQNVVPTPNSGDSSHFNDDGSRNGATGKVVVRYEIA